MSNSYFNFKQFTIYQDKTAMKVGTDGILLGAWGSVEENPSRVLDIGTGTGLIALMLAQRTGAPIDAVEVDETAAQQAAENVANSPWPNRVTVFHTPIQTFNPVNPYDLIVCNPPFYQHAYNMGQTVRSTARHGVSLDCDGLTASVNRLLSATGRFSLIAPSHLGDEFSDSAERAGLILRSVCHVCPKPGVSPKRRLLSFSRESGECVTTQLTVETETRHVYTDEYRALTGEFYL